LAAGGNLYLYDLEAGVCVKNSGVLFDLVLRFLLGGGAVAGCYVLLLILPWKSFAGIFAAFPAVLASAVIMSGWLEGREAASQLAIGATAGMLGCTVCVAVALWGLLAGIDWVRAIGLSILAWLISSLLFISLVKKAR
jgi:hypothetical protein